MEKNIRIEEATSNDAEILAEISKRAFHTDAKVFGFDQPGGPPGYDTPEFQNWAMRTLTYYKILYDEEIVGGIILDSEKIDHHILERIFVDPRYHNKGIATKVMNLIFNKYPEVVWTLGTPEWNARTRHFYEKLGFNQVGWDEGDAELGWRGIWYQRTTDKTKSSVQNLIDLNNGMTGVVVEGEIVKINPPTQVKSKKDGKELTVAHAILCDKSGEITLVLWNNQISQVKSGEKIRIEFGGVNSYRDNLQLNIGFGRVIKLL
ncbi:MAG: GNAT family N-acetyltransferase [Candidatus Lokiarchaeota archaeon]|nr:GNAT family N-acetyltransferase [Candidatus Lokiarchaeota archaeon]